MNEEQPMENKRFEELLGLLLDLRKPLALITPI